MQQLSWFFLPPTYWWAAAVALSVLLVAASICWLAWRNWSPQTALIFAALAVVWWSFGFASALWPLRGLDEFSQWARASSYVVVPLWMGGVAWIAALLVARFLRTARAGQG
ncbi:MAG: hypothetical protein RSD57_05705 [Comamonas sp.]